mgnify:CR=1 FL=1
MKKYIIIITIIILFLILVLNFKTVLDAGSNFFWNIVGEQLDKEEQERAQKINNGEIVRGKDTILIWNDIFDIGHYYDGDYLSLYSSGVYNNILRNVISHRIHDDKLYVVSEEGCSVIDEDNLCKVYITGSVNSSVDTDIVDGEENTLKNDQHVENKHIKYLKSFSEFSQEDRQIFTELKK